MWFSSYLQHKFCLISRYLSTEVRNWSLNSKVLYLGKFSQLNEVKTNVRWWGDLEYYQLSNKDRTNANICLFDPVKPRSHNFFAHNIEIKRYFNKKIQDISIKR